MAETKKVVEETTEEKIRKEQEDLFRKFIQLNVNDHTDMKNNLTYLSWAWAWQEFLKICPEATYEIKKFTNPITGKTTTYLEDDDLGFMVYTSITARGVTREMWLPVMDGANKSMKRQSYTYIVGKGDKQYEKSVEAISMFDVNKTIMRCLTKNIAMFGLGIYIYAGEDLPIELGEPITVKQIERIRELEIIEPNVCKKFKVGSIEELTYQQAEFVINAKEKAMKG